MPEAYQQIETDEQKDLMTAAEITERVLAVDHLELSPGGAELVLDSGPQYTPDQIKEYSPLVSLENGDEVPEANLPDFLRAHVEDMMQLLDQKSYREIVRDDGRVSSVEKIKLLEKLLPLITSADFSQALEKLGVKLNTLQNSVVLSVAAIQTAILEEAQALADTKTQIKTTTSLADPSRRSLYTEIAPSYKRTPGYQLEGEKASAFSRVLRLSSEGNSAEVPVSLIQTAITRSLSSEASEKDKNQASLLLMLIHNQFPENENIQRLNSIYTKYKNGKTLTESERTYLEQISNTPSHIEEILSSLPTTPETGIHNKMHKTVREDLMAAQQIINTLVPPHILIPLADMETKRDQLYTQLKDAKASGNRQTEEQVQKDMDMITAEITQYRQKMYKAAMYAFQVKAADTSSYPSTRYTNEEKALGEEIRQRSVETVSYQDYRGKNRKTRRDELNAVDANRLTTIEVLKHLGIDTSHFSWEEMIANGQALAPEVYSQYQSQDPSHRRSYQSLMREALGEYVTSHLGLDQRAPQYALILKIIRDHLQTEQRLYGIEHQIQDQTNGIVTMMSSRFKKLTGDLADNLKLTLFKDMGLKGIELLYRRSLTKTETSQVMPYPEDLKKPRKIRMMKIVQKPQEMDDLLSILSDLNGNRDGEKPFQQERQPQPSGDPQLDQPDEISTSEDLSQYVDESKNHPLDGEIAFDQEGFAYPKLELDFRVNGYEIGIKPESETTASFKLTKDAEEPIILPHINLAELLQLDSGDDINSKNTITNPFYLLAILARLLTTPGSESFLLPDQARDKILNFIHKKGKSTRAVDLSAQVQPDQRLSQKREK